MKLFKALTTAVITAALLVVPAGALAKDRDRDHDGMPDKWEKAHHLNFRVKDARKDPDRDHLSNLSEFRHHTNPHKADTDRDGINDGREVRDRTNPRSDDSDRDGVEDGDEISGTVVSFQNGVLTIQLARAGAGNVSGTVNDQTRIECDDNEQDDDAPTTTARASHDGPGGDDGDNSGPGSDNHGRDDDDQGDDNDNDDDNDDGQCTVADLKQGAVVHEAKLAKAADGSNVFTKIELVPASSS